jgi:hypothetical protein
MWLHDHRAGAVSAIVVALLCASAAGCALTRGDFVQRDSTPVAATTPVEVRPAVLVQEGGPAAAATDQSIKAAAAANPPPTPKADATPKEAKLLSPEEKARVVAELEALARGQTAGEAAAAKADCAVIAYAKPTATQTVEAANCAQAPKPALRP